MRAISRFPLPDSHVSLSAVLEPGPNAQPAPPPRPAPRQSNLPQNQGAPNPKPTPPDTPRHHTPSRPRTGPPPPLPDCCATQTGASLRPGAQSPRPSPASSTNPHRQSAKTRDLHAPKAHNLRRRQRPLPAIEHQDAPTNSFRPKLQPPPQFGVRPPKRPTDQDNTSTLKPPGLRPQSPLFKVRFDLSTESPHGTRSPRTLHCFLAALTDLLHPPRECVVNTYARNLTTMRVSAPITRAPARSGASDVSPPYGLRILKI
jgi:hypothetical protein